MAISFVSSYSQNFDSLSATTATSVPWSNDSTIPGWSLFRQPAPGTAITGYAVSSGGTNTGSFFSFGTTPERALGGQGSGGTYFGSPASAAVAGWITVGLENDSGATINAVNLSFNGEQWRNGGNTSAQTMVLEYGFGVTFETVAAWTAPGGTFNWASPVVGATAVAVDGNTAGRVTAVGGTLNSLNWAADQTLWIRWIEVNDTGSDHGLAIDDFSLSLVSGPPAVTLSVSTNAASEAGATAVTVTATASAPVSGDQTVTVAVSGTDITLGDYTLSNTLITILNGASSGSVTFTVVDDNDVEGTETATLTIGSPSAGITIGSPASQNIAITDNDAPPPPPIVINELDSDTTGTDVAEFVELFGPANASLNGLVLVFYNGSNDLSYFALDLDGFSLDANGYFVAGNSAVPGVDAIFSNGTLQNGADAVALYSGNGSDFPNNTPVRLNGLLDAVVYDTNDADDPGLLPLLNPGQPQIDEATPETNAIARLPNGSGGARNTASFVAQPPTPGTTNDPAPPPPPQPRKIHEIQGSGATSPLAGQGVIVEGIVTADFTGTGRLNGFYLQEEDADGDGNAATSEGIFVFLGNGGSPVAVGDKVSLTANVLEFGTVGASLTELTSVSNLTVVSTGNALPAAVSLSFPQATTSALEAVEGMRVSVTTTMTVDETFDLPRFGEVLLASGDANTNAPGTDARIDQYTQFHAPSVAGNTAYQLAVAPRLLILDDASSQTNRDPIVYGRGGNPLSASNTLRGGDTVGSLSGILDDRFRGNANDPYRLQPTDAVNFQAVNQRGPVPDVGGALVVASLNVLNYFNGDGLGGGFPTSRGADSLAEFNRQRDKVIAAIIGTGADVIGLLEIENDGFGPNSAIQDLVNGLNAAAGAGTYAFVNPGVSLGTDLIAVGLLYKPAEVTMVGASAVLNNSVDPRFNSAQQRPSLAQTFRDNDSGALFTPVINHLKSKGGAATNNPGDTDNGDGQGDSNFTRTQAALALSDWLASDPTNQGDTDFLILGDLNAYAHEDPLTALHNGADDSPGTADDYTNLVPDTTYSYAFGGQWGALDHALGSPHLQAQVSGADKWHINADEPTALDYNVEDKTPNLQATLYAPDAFRASDHDAVIVGLHLLGSTRTGTARGEVLSGTEGNDRITGGGGRDWLAGLGDGDVFVYNSLLDAYDFITGFTPGQDRLDIGALLASVGYGGNDPVGAGYLSVVLPGGALTIGGVVIGTPHTIVMFDSDGTAGPGVPRPLVELIGVSVADPHLLIDLSAGQ